MPTSAIATSADPTRSSVERPRTRSSSPRPASASATVTAASGTLIRKTQRQEIVCTMTPPSGGPPTVARLVSDVQRPIARPACPAHVTRRRARLVVVRTAPPTPCSARPPISTPSLGASAVSSDASGEQHDADDERAPQPDAVADRAADEVERRQRQRVGEVHPLLAREAEPQVLLHRAAAPRSRPSCRGRRAPSRAPSRTGSASARGGRRPSAHATHSARRRQIRHHDRCTARLPQAHTVTIVTNR